MDGRGSEEARETRRNGGRARTRRPGDRMPIATNRGHLARELVFSALTDPGATDASHPHTHAVDAPARIFSPPPALHSCPTNSPCVSSTQIARFPSFFQPPQSRRVPVRLPVRSKNRVLRSCEQIGLSSRVGRRRRTPLSSTDIGHGLHDLNARSVGGRRLERKSSSALLI